MNLLIYYNPNQLHFYTVYTNYINYYVGYENSYGHILIQILAFRNKKYVNISEWLDLFKIPVKKESLKSRLAKRMIRWLNKYRE